METFPFSNLKKKGGIPEVRVSLIVRVILLPVRSAVIIHVPPIRVGLARFLTLVHVFGLVRINRPRLVTFVRNELVGNVTQIAPTRHDHLLAAQG